MKKPYFLHIVAALLFSGSLFFGMGTVVHADINSAEPITQLMNTNLSAVPSEKVNIKIIKKTITDTSAQFDVQLDARVNTPTIVVITGWNPENKEIFKQVVWSRTMFTAGSKKIVSIDTFRNLIPGTTYTIQFSDTAQSTTGIVKYQKISFTTLGESPAETNEPVDVQKTSLTLTPDDPIIEIDDQGNTVQANNPTKPVGKNENYKVTFKGKFVSTLNLRTNMQLFLGTDQVKPPLVGTLFTNAVIPKNTEQNYELTIHSLKPNTTYYYKIYESTKEFDVLTIKSFTTPLDGSALESTAAPDVQKAAISVTLNTPTFVENKRKDGTITAIDVTISGKILTTLNTRVGLELWLAPTTSLFKAGNTLSPTVLIFKGVEKKFSQTVHSLQPGTKYYYQVKEITKDFFTTAQPMSFTTPGTVITTGTFDPNAPGIFTDYDFNTNLGEPTGDGSANITEPSVLVPCGKRADQNSEENKNCKFEHLMILFGRIIDYLLVLLVPLTVLVAIYTGVQMILHRQIPAELMKYKDNLIRIGWGVAVMLLAWTIIATLLKTFVDPGSMRFILLDLLG